MSNQLITVNLVVLNGERYIRHCLDGILAQTYPHELIELNILDNGSLDNTRSIIESYKLQATSPDREIEDPRLQGNRDYKLPRFFLLESKKNLGMWPGQEELLKYSNGKYILAMAVDVVLDKDFVKNAVETMEKDPKIGALQAKIYKFELTQLPTSNPQLLTSKVIDTCGFQIFRSRRVINIGHGLSFAEVSVSKGFNFNKEQEIFGVEGACPFFRREALESCRIQLSTVNRQPSTSEIFDHDYFWYGDDLDLAWRMRLFGWKQIFTPSVIAWHDRQTTKKLRKSFSDFLRIRHSLPLRKRQLEWKNIRWTIIKNDYIINILKDLPYILKREIAMLGYLILFEPAVLLEISRFFKLLPKMFKKRKEIMRKAILPPAEIQKWFQ